MLNGTQQQFVVRNSNLDGWTNGVWNQVFSGDVGAPAQNFGSGGQYTTLASSPVTEEEPFLQQDSAGNYSVFVPAVQHNSAGTTWGSGPTPGSAIPIQRFFIASPSTPVWLINAALAVGKDLILTPGVYSLNQPILVTRPGTVVLGLGFPTLVPARGNVAMQVASVPGVKLSGMIFDAGTVNSPALLQVGFPGFGWSDPADPTLVQDVFFRIGGATPGQASDSLVVNSSQVILDDIWAWRADHGNGVGWTSNVGNTGVLVNGDDVTAYGLFVEHYEQAQVIWNGRDGTDIFFQNEMPYDPPSQAAWMENASHGRLPGVPDHVARGGLLRLRDGQLQLLQPGRAHLRHQCLRGGQPAGAAPVRHADDLPQRHRRIRRDRPRGERRRRLDHDREPGHPGQRGELSITDGSRAPGPPAVGPAYGLVPLRLVSQASAATCSGTSGRWRAWSRRYRVKAGIARPITTAPATVARPPASALITGVVSEPSAPASRLPSCPPPAPTM